MNVGCAVVDCIEQHFLDELDDRGVVDFLAACIFYLGGSFFVEKIEIDVIAADVFQAVFRRFGKFADQRHQLGVFDNNGVYRQTGLEADFVECPQVGRVGDGDRQAVAALVERDDLVGRHELAVDGGGRDMGFVEGVQVEQRIAEGVCNKAGNVECRSFLAGNDLFDQRDFG